MDKFIVRIKDPYDNGIIDVIRFSKRDAENYLQREIKLSKQYGIEITGEIISEKNLSHA